VLEGGHVIYRDDPDGVVGEILSVVASIERAS
jgi:hypothetical protein